MNRTSRMLVVDDEPEILGMAAAVLRSAGYEVWEASTGSEGLASARQHRPDIVLLDVHLPDVLGTEVCRQIKNDPDLEDVFVALFSGEATSGAAQLLGVETGADDYILKPIGGEELLARIRMLARLRDTTVALRASEQHYRGLVQILPEAVALMDRQGRITGGNPQGLSLLGYASEDELLGKTLFDLCPLEEHEGLRAAIREILETGSPQTRELTVVGKDGQLIRLEAKAAAVLGPAGRPVGLVSVARDVTRRKSAEKALRDSEELFRQFAEHIREVFWMTDPAKTRILYVSPAYESIWGRSRESVYQVPLSWVESVHPEDRERVLEAARTRQVTGEYDETYRIVRPDGSFRWIRDRAFPIRNEAGEVYRLLGIAEDITARKKTEEQLTVLAHAVQSTSQAICITDLEDRFTFANRAFEHMYGYTQGEILGEKPSILASSRNPPSVIAEIVAGTRAGGWRGEVIDLRKNGTEVPVYLSTSQIRDYTGKVIGLMGVAEDITERKQAEAVLRQSEERFRQAMEAAGFIAWHIDIATGVITYSDNIKALVGGDDIERYCSVEGVLGQMHPADRGPTARKLESALTGKESFEMEYRTRMLDGSYRWILGQGRAVPDAEGRPRQAIGISLDITARKAAEEALRASEENTRLLADALQSAQELISVTDHQNRLTFVNAAFLKTYGYTEDEVLGRTPEFLYSAANPPGLCQQVYEATLAGGWRGEIINRRKDGTEFPISLATSEIKTREGKTLGLLGVARDISERIRNERLQRALVGLGHRLSAATVPASAAQIILEVASDLFGWDAGYVHLYSEAEDRVVWLQTMDTVEGRRVPVPVPSSKPSALMRQVMKEGARIINGEGALTSSCDLERFGDTGRPSAAMLYAPIRSSGKAIGVLSIQSYTPGAYNKADVPLLQALADYCGDALLRLKVREALENTRRLQQTILDNIPDPAWLQDAEGRILACNSALAKFHGRDQAWMIGRTAFDFAPREAARLTDENAMVMKSGKPGIFEQPRSDAHGVRRWFEAIKAPVFDEQGRNVGMVGIARETTEHKRLEEELRGLPRRITEAQEAERQRVARELHDSVNQILASAQMRLRKVEESSAEFRPSTREILARCRELLVQALEENRRISHDLRPSDLDELGFEVACRNFCRQFQARTEVVVACRLGKAVPRLAPSAALNLFRIVQEAFNNIEKHARAKKILLRLLVKGESLVLKIQDDGCGFDPKAPRINKARRTGIGLTNIRERAAALRGICEVESAPGKGTTVTVTVPQPSLRG